MCSIWCPESRIKSVIDMGPVDISKVILGDDDTLPMLELGERPLVPCSSSLIPTPHLSGPSAIPVSTTGSDAYKMLEGD